MEAVLLGLTPAVRVADRQSPLAGALRRELAAVTGLAVTPLDLDPRDEGLFDALADALEECQVLVTIGDLEHPGGLRRLLTRGLGLETRIDPDALADAEAWCRAHPEARIAPGELAEVPAIAEVFRTGGVCGFGLRTAAGDPLPARATPNPSCRCCSGRDMPSWAASWAGRSTRWNCRQMGWTLSSSTASWMEKTLPMALEYNLVSTGAGQRLRLIAPEQVSIWGRKPPSISCPTRRSRSRNRRADRCCPQRIRSLPFRTDCRGGAAPPVARQQGARL